MRVLIETCGPAQDREEQDLAVQGDVEALLAQLEGQTDVTVSFGLSPTSEEVELILGITSEGYLLTRYEDGDFQQLIGNPSATGDIELILGGQSTLTPNRWLVAKAEVVRIIGQYVRDSTFPSGLSWEQP